MVNINQMYICIHSPYEDKQQEAHMGENRLSEGMHLSGKILYIARFVEYYRL